MGRSRPIEQLVERAKAGDESAREELFASIGDPVLRIVRRRLGGRLRGRMESVDVAQSVLAEAVRDFDEFEWRGEGALMRWLARIVENKLRREARAIEHGDRDPRRRKPLDPADSVAPGHEPSAGGPGLVTQLGREEDQRRLRRALGHLSDRERRLVELRDLKGLPWQEVTEQAGESSLKAAEGAHRRARIRLASLLADEEPSS